MSTGFDTEITDDGQLAKPKTSPLSITAIFCLAPKYFELKIPKIVGF